MNKLFLILTSLLALLPQLVQAQSATPWQGEAEVRARLISGVDATGDLATLPLGLDIQLAPHWKTYWRTPGTAGFPVSIDWSGSTNLKSASIAWPAPMRFEYAGIETFGYTDALVLPITATPETPGQPVSLKAQISMMACAELCIPFNFEVALEVPAGIASSSEYASSLGTWQKRVPQTTHTQLGINDVRRTENGYSVTVTADPPLGAAPELIVEAPSGLMYGTPARPAGTSSPVTLFVNRLDTNTQSEPDKQITLTLIDGDRALEKTVSLTALNEAVMSAPAQSVSLLSALIAAFIGGLILNLMPCVLPVLSLKLLSIVSHGGSPPRHVRLSFLASAAGIITSFLALAAIAISFKQAGYAIGWGLQFQHPGFIITMSVLITLFAASLWNLIHIPLPRFMADAINDNLPAPGQHDRTLLGNFMTGAFATILATPCSAPFVGTALGFALAGSSSDILLTAFVMGLGLATPFLLVAAFPRLANKLPRPGRWMEWLKTALGFALLFTAIWLVSTSRQQLPEDTAVYVVGLPLFIIVLLVVRASFTRPVILLKATLGLLVMLGLASAYDAFTRTPAAAHINWQPFSQDRIAALVAENRVVFVDVTADWCLTCLANKKLVLNAEPTLSLLRGGEVVAMKADWTRPNDEIAAYLKSFGRYGIPFNIVYGPNAPQGIPLPELLTAESVTKAIEDAAIKD